MTTNKKKIIKNVTFARCCNAFSVNYYPSMQCLSSRAAERVSQEAQALTQPRAISFFLSLPRCVEEQISWSATKEKCFLHVERCLLLCFFIIYFVRSFLLAPKSIVVIPIATNIRAESQTEAMELEKEECFYRVSMWMKSRFSLLRRATSEAKTNIVVLSIKLILNLGLWIYILHFSRLSPELLSLWLCVYVCSAPFVCSGFRICAEFISLLAINLWI